MGSTIAILEDYVRDEDHPLNSVNRFELGDEDNPLVVYELKGYRYQAGPDGIIYVHRNRRGVWRPQAFRVVAGRLPVFMPDKVFARRDELTAAWLAMCEAHGVDPVDGDLQVKLQNQIEELGGAHEEAAGDLVEELHRLESLGWIPGWPDEYLVRGLTKHFTWSRERDHVPPGEAPAAEEPELVEAE